MSRILRVQDQFGKPITCLAQLPADVSTLMVFEGYPGDRFKVKAWESAGHTEVTFSRTTDWEEVDYWEPHHFREYFEALDREREENKEQREQRNREKACKRAKKAVRRLCKTMGADTLLTLTYKACEVDLARVKADLREFNRRIKRLLPNFCFVAAFEKQKRGAWHMHLATRAIPADLPASNGVKVKSFNVIRSIWRSVVGDRGGNIDVSRRKRHSAKSAAQIASYISSYIAKDFADGDKWVNRYTVYGGVEVPEAVTLGYVDSVRESIELCVGLLGDGDRIVNMVLGFFHDSFYLCAEPTVPRPS